MRNMGIENKLAQLGVASSDISIRDLTMISTPLQTEEGVSHLRGYFPLISKPIEQHIVRGGVKHRETGEVIPEIVAQNVQVEVMVGDDRHALEEAHTIGDASLVLYYKQKPAVVVSFSVSPSEKTLTIHQLQSIHNHRGFRLFTGLDCPRLVGASLLAIAQHPSTPCSKIEMPIPDNILGMDSAIHQRSAVSQQLSPNGPTEKYIALARALHMEQVGNKFIRVIAKGGE